MQRRRALRSHRFQIKTFEYLEHLQRDKALRGGRHLIDIIASITGADRFHPIRLMIGEIFAREVTTELFRTTHDLLRDLACVENGGAIVGNSSERLCHPGILENLTDLWRPSANEIADRRSFISF